jgi:hypothetical protein
MHRGMPGINTMLVFVRRRPLGEQLLFRYLLHLSIFRFVYQHHLATGSRFTPSSGRLSFGPPHHVIT